VIALGYINIARSELCLHAIWHMTGYMSTATLLIKVVTAKSNRPQHNCGNCDDIRFKVIVIVKITIIRPNWLTSVTSYRSAFATPICFIIWNKLQSHRSSMGFNWIITFLTNL